LVTGGTLLDWPEQASVVLPVLLAALVLAGSNRKSTAATVERRKVARTLSVAQDGPLVAEPSTQPS
jgi:hypothetical protein